MQNWFEGCKSEGEIKTRWRELAKQHHPDLGGDCDTMQAINAAYESALKSDYRAQGMDEAKAAWRWDMDAEIMAKAVEILKAARALRVEICGLWIWITGDTRAAKDILKAAGCRFAAKKCAWYWRRETDGYRRRRHKPLELDRIRQKYGSYAVNVENDNQVVFA